MISKNKLLFIKFDVYVECLLIDNIANFHLKNGRAQGDL